MKQAYITALVNSLLEGKEVDSLLLSTKQLLAKKGHERLWPAILRGALRELERSGRANVPQVTLSKDSKETSAKLSEALKALGVEGDATYETKIDESLIGGFIVRYKDRMIDASYKKALVDLYRKVTKL
jgi:F-type H+-transporting ATPase subunit delta